MFDITTTRLRLLPLTYSQLLLLAEGLYALEDFLQLNRSSFELNADPSFLQEFSAAIQSYTIPQVLAHPEDHAWYTHWLVIHQEDNLIVGGIGCTGLPDGNGQSMIGYFIDKKYEGKGLATEAVSGLINWMLQHPQLNTIIADTIPGNGASEKVLLKNDFIYHGPVDEGSRWIRSK